MKSTHAFLLALLLTNSLSAECLPIGSPGAGRLCAIPPDFTMGIDCSGVGGGDTEPLPQEALAWPSREGLEGVHKVVADGIVDNWEVLGRLLGEDRIFLGRAIRGAMGRYPVAVANGAHWRRAGEAILATEWVRAARNCRVVRVRERLGWVFLVRCTDLRADYIVRQITAAGGFDHVDLPSLEESQPEELAAERKVLGRLIRLDDEEADAVGLAALRSTDRASLSAGQAAAFLRGFLRVWRRVNTLAERAGVEVCP